MWYKVKTRATASGWFSLQGKVPGFLFLALVLLTVAYGTVSAQDGTPVAPTAETGLEPEIPDDDDLLRLSVLPSEIPVLEGQTAEVFLLLDRYSSQGITVGYVVYSRDYDSAVAGEDYEGHDDLQQITFHKSAQVDLTTLADQVAEPMESFHFEVVAVSAGVLAGDLPSRQARIWVEDLPAILATPTPDPNVPPTPTPDPNATPEPTPTPWPTSPPIPTVSPADTAPAPEPEPPPPSRMSQAMPWLLLVGALGGGGYLAYRKGWLDRWIQRKTDTDESEEADDEQK